MSILTTAREFARPAATPFTFGRAVTLLAGVVAVGVDHVMTRAELARSDAFVLPSLAEGPLATPARPTR